METRFMGYRTYEEDGNVFVIAPCGCDECNDNVQHGHSCSISPDVLLQAEKDGLVVKVYIDYWRWLVVL